MRTRRKFVQGFASLMVLVLVGVTASGAWAVAEDGNIFDRVFQRNNANSFSGTWETVKVNGDRFTWKLRQTGNNVTGTYSPGNGKIEGKAKDSVLRLQWKQDGSQGSARLTLSPDGQIFMGTFNNTNDPDAYGKWWNGVRPGKPSFEGTWNLVSSSNAPYTAVLQQEGKNISGTFEPGEGRIEEGKVSDGKLSFKWRRTGVGGTYRGNGRLKLSDDGQSLTGSFNTKEGPATGEENYTATRIPPSFQGSWTWKEANTDQDIVFKTMQFTQVGDKVSTQDFMGGIVLGRTLFFNWDATGLNHNAVLILSNDGKSFHGMFNHDGDNRREAFPTKGQYVGVEVNPGK